MGKFFSTLFASLGAKARAVLAFMIPIVKTHAGDVLAAALPIAEGIVVQLAAGSVPNAQKRDAAVSQLRDVMVKQGYATAADLATSTLNLAVEMAVSKLKTS